MNRLYIIIFLLNFTLIGQAQKPIVTEDIDWALSAKSDKPFNGVVMFEQDGKVMLTKAYGFSDLDKKTPLKLDNQFVIGSISKQMTAVLVLQAYEQGYIDLNTPIHKYLPKLKMAWADTVTVHHLLTHTHGIKALDKPLAFRPGTQYDYSQIGFELLAQVVEKTRKKSFAKLAAQMFKHCDMKNSFHPDIHRYKQLAKGYTEQVNGKLQFETASMENYVAAGGFISTAEDLCKWNNCLHNGKLLKPDTYKMMTTKQPNAIRQHPLFGSTTYGYGTTITDTDNLLQLGQTGFTPGFISMCYYYPKTKTSIILLDNTVWNPNDLKAAFRYHTNVLSLVKVLIR